jgi:hypothetical protein
MRRSVDGGSPPVNYFAFSRTSGPVTKTIKVSSITVGT